MLLIYKEMWQIQRDYHLLIYANYVNMSEGNFVIFFVKSKHDFLIWFKTFFSIILFFSGDKKNCLFRFFVHFPSRFCLVSKYVKWVFRFKKKT